MQIQNPPSEFDRDCSLLAGSSGDQNDDCALLAKIIDLVNDVNDPVGGENVFGDDPCTVCHHYLKYGVEEADAHARHHHDHADELDHGDNHCDPW